MSQETFGKTYGGSAPENYERYFVPAIAAPVAKDLLEAVALRPGQRVLDVACGTGVLARLAAEEVGPEGSVAGLDVNSCMLDVARSTSPSASSIEWYETSAEAMPLRDATFDVVLCQMGLQFIPNKLAALREMRRVLAPGGRVAINLPGPTPPVFTILADALARHVDSKSAFFAQLVFALHHADELRELMTGAGFQSAEVRAAERTLHLPAPDQFLWQYVYSTPLAAPVKQADPEQRAALERDVVSKWKEFVADGALMLRLRMTTVTAEK